MVELQPPVIWQQVIKRMPIKAGKPDLVTSPHAEQGPGTMMPRPGKVASEDNSSTVRSRLVPNVGSWSSRKAKS